MRDAATLLVVGRLAVLEAAEVVVVAGVPSRPRRLPSHPRAVRCSWPARMAPPPATQTTGEAAAEAAGEEEEAAVAAAVAAAAAAAAGRVRRH